MSEVTLRFGSVPYGQQPAVLSILDRHGFESDDPAAAGRLLAGEDYTSLDARLAVTARALARAAPGCVFLGIDDSDGTRTATAFAPGLGSFSSECDSSGDFLAHASTFASAVLEAVNSAGTVAAARDAVGAVLGSWSGQAWEDRLAAADRETAATDDSGTVLLCGTCLSAADGPSPGESAGGRTPDGDQEPDEACCQWCGAAGQRRPARKETAERALPVAVRQDQGEWVLAWPSGLRSAPYASAGDAWAGWQAGNAVPAPHRDGSLPRLAGGARHPAALCRQDASGPGKSRP